MAATLDNINLQVRFLADLQNILDLVTAKVPLDKKYTLTWTTGTGLNQANAIFSDQRTIAASSNDDLDLAGGLTDGLGATLTFTRIKAILIFAAVANVNNVVMGNAAANGFVGPFGAATHTLSVRPGGLEVLMAPDATGYAVTAGTGDILRIANSAGGSSVVYDIVLIGTV